MGSNHKGHRTIYGDHIRDHGGMNGIIVSVQR